MRRSLMAPGALLNGKLSGPLRALTATMLTAVVVGFLLFVPGARAQISTVVNTDTSSYLLGQTINFNGVVSLTAGETDGITQVDLKIEQTTGPGPVFFPTFTVELPIEAGFYDSSNFPNVPGDLTVIVGTQNIGKTGPWGAGYGLGYAYAYSLTQAGAPGQITYTIFWDAPIFLDPGPVFTLIPNTEALFAVPLPVADVLPEGGPVDLPDATSQFVIPSVPVAGLPVGAPDPLPSVTAAFSVPYLVTEAPAAVPLPTSELAFSIPMGGTTVVGAPSDLPAADLLFAIPSGETASTIAPLPTVSKLFDIPFVGTVVSGTQLPLTDTAFAVPLPPVSEPIAGIPELPATEKVFDILVGGVARAPHGVTVDPDGNFYVLVDSDGADQIAKYDSTGAIVTAFGTSGVATIHDHSGLGGIVLQEAEGITFLNDGSKDILLVAENTQVGQPFWKDRNILSFNPTTGAFIDVAFYSPNNYRIGGIHADPSTSPASVWLTRSEDNPSIYHKDLNGNGLDGDDRFLGFGVAASGGVAASASELFTAEGINIQKRDNLTPDNTIGTAFNPATVAGVVGLALDSSGVMYIADSDSNAIYKTQFFLAETVTQNPLGLAYDSSADELYILVESAPLHKIVVVDPDDSGTATVIRSFDAPDNKGVGITYLGGVLFYATNPGAWDRQVFRLDPSDGEIQGAFSPSGAWDSLRGLANNGEKLLLTVKNDTRIVDADPSNGQDENSFYPEGEAITAPNAIAVNSAGSIYAAKNTDLVEMDGDGNVLRTFTLSGFDTEALTFVNGVLFIGNDADDTIRKASIPSGITTTPIDMTYASYSGNDTIWLLVDAVPNDKIIRMVDDGTETDADGDGTSWDLVDSFDAPNGNSQGITANDDGVLTVVHRGDNDPLRASHIDPDTGSVNSTFNLAESCCNETWSNSSALAFDGEFLVYGRPGNDWLRKNRYSNGNFEEEIGPPWGGNAFTGPAGLAIKSDGQVLESKDEEVIQLAPDLSTVATFTTTLDDITGLAINDDLVYLADDGGDAVYSAGLPSGLTTDPLDIAHDGTNLWVLVNGAIYDRVLRLNPATGALIAQFNAPDNKGAGLTYLDGSLYYASRQSNSPVSVSELSTSGVVANTFQPSSQHNNEINDDVTSMSNDGDYLVLAISGQSDLYRVDPSDGEFESAIPENCCVDGDAVNGAEAIVLNSAGSVFEGDDDEVIWLTSSLDDVQTFTTGLDEIQGLAMNSGTLFIADAGDNTIHQASVPTGLTTDPIDLAHDGTNLWVLVDGLTTDRILKLNASTGALVAEFDAPNNGGVGLTALGGDLYYASNMAGGGCCGDERKIFVLNSSGVEQDSFNPDGCCGQLHSDITALTNDGEFLIIGISGQTNLMKNDASDGGNEEEIHASGSDAISGTDALARSSAGQYFEAKNKKVIQLTASLGNVASFTTTLQDITALVYASDVLFMANDDDNKIYIATAPTDITTNPIDLAYSTENNNPVVWVLIEAAPKYKIAKMVNDGTDDDSDGNVWDLANSPGFDAPDATGVGITYLDGHLYYATNTEDEGQCCGPPDTRKVVKLDPSDGAELDRFSPSGQCQGTLCDDITGMTNDGEYLAIATKNNDRIYLFDPDGGSSEGELPSECCQPPSGIDGAEAVAIALVDDEVVYVYQAEDEEIIQLEASTFNESGNFTTDREDITGMVIGGLLLYVADDADDTVYVTRPPSPITNNPLGITFSDTHGMFILVDASPTDHVILVNRSTGALIDNFSVDSNVASGITYLDGSLWVSTDRQQDPCCDDAKIFKINPDTGDEIDDFNVQPNHAEPGGMTNDGEFLILVDGSNNDYYVMNTGGGNESESHRQGGTPSGGRAMAYSSEAEATFYAKNNDIAQLTSDMYDSEDDWENTSVEDIQGMTFVSDATFGEILYLVSGDDNTVYSALVPAGEVILTSQAKGMTTDGTNLYLLLEASPTDKIVVVDANDVNDPPAIISKINAPKGESGGITLFDHDNDGTATLFVAVNRDAECQQCPYGSKERYIVEMDTSGNKVRQWEVQGTGQGMPPTLELGALTNNGTILLIGARETYDIPNANVILENPINENTINHVMLPPSSIGNNIESMMVAIGKLYVANATNVVQFDLDLSDPYDHNMFEGSIEAQFPLDGGSRDVKGLAYISPTAYMADRATDGIRISILPGNTPETTIVGTYKPTFTAVSDDVEVEVEGAAFVIARNSAPVIQIDDPADGFSTSQETITIRGRVNDPSIETLVVGVDLPFTIIFEDTVEAASSGDLWTSTGLWNIATKGDPADKYPKNNSEASAWYYGQNNNFSTGSRTSGYLTTVDPILVGQGAVLTSYHWYETETDPEFDQKKIQIAEVTTNSEGEDVVGSYETLAQIVDFVPASSAPNEAHSSFQWVTVPPSAFTFGEPTPLTPGTAPTPPTQKPLFIRQDLGLDDFVGQRVMIRFFFDSIDPEINEGEGWYVDDVSLSGSGFKGKTVTVSPIPGGPLVEGNVSFFSEFETTFDLAEGDNDAKIGGKLPYPPFKKSADTVSGFLDKTPPAVEFDPLPETTNVVTQTISGTIIDTNFQEAQLLQETVFGEKTIAVVKQDGNTTMGFSKTANLTEGSNKFTMIAKDGADLETIVTMVVNLDQTGPSVSVLATTYPKGLVSARTGDLLVFQVNATDEIGVASVKLTIPGGGLAPFIPTGAVPDAILSQFGVTGGYMFPMLVPSGAPSGTLSFVAKAADTAGNETTVQVEAQIVPTLDAFVINMMPGANNFSLPLIPGRDSSVRLGMDVRDFASNLRQITGDTRTQDKPNFDSNNERIVFEQTDSTGQVDIWVMDADGSNRVNLTNTPNANEYAPAFTQDDTVVVYISDSNKALTLQAVDPAGPSVVISIPDANNPQAWPDGTTIPEGQWTVGTWIPGTDGSDPYIDQQNRLGVNQVLSAQGIAIEGFEDRLWVVVSAPVYDENGQVVGQQSVSAQVRDLPELTDGAFVYANGYPLGKQRFTGYNPADEFHSVPNPDWDAEDQNSPRHLKVWTADGDIFTNHCAISEAQNCDPRIVTTSTIVESNPTLNSDGTRIAFLTPGTLAFTATDGSSQTRETMNINVMNFDATNRIALSNDGGVTGSLAKPPAGYDDRLLYSSNRAVAEAADGVFGPGGSDLYTVEPRLLAGTEAIWWYNALETGDEADRWHVFTPGDAPDDLETLETGRGYWAITKDLEATKDDDGFEWELSAPLAAGLSETPTSLDVSYYGTFLEAGKAVPPVYRVVGGGGGKWNQIGYHGETALEVAKALSTLEVPQRIWGALFQYDNLIQFDLEGDDTIVLGAFRRLLSDDEITPGAGYWIFMIEDGAIVAGGGGTQ